VEVISRKILGNELEVENRRERGAIFCQEARRRHRGQLIVAIMGGSQK